MQIFVQTFAYMEWVLYICIIVIHKRPTGHKKTHHGSNWGSINKNNSVRRQGQSLSPENNTKWANIWKKGVLYVPSKRGTERDLWYIFSRFDNLTHICERCLSWKEERVFCCTQRSERKEYFAILKEASWVEMTKKPVAEKWRAFFMPYTFLCKMRIFA